MAGIANRIQHHQAKQGVVVRYKARQRSFLHPETRRFQLAHVARKIGFLPVARHDKVGAFDAHGVVLHQRHRQGNFQGSILLAVDFCREAYPIQFCQAGGELLNERVIHYLSVQLHGVRCFDRLVRHIRYGEILVNFGKYQVGQPGVVEGSRQVRLHKGRVHGGVFRCPVRREAHIHAVEFDGFAVFSQYKVAHRNHTQRVGRVGGREISVDLAL